MRWIKVFWISLPISVAWTFIVPALGWPNPLALPAIAFQWYVSGRASQQAMYRKPTQPEIPSVDCWCGESIPTPVEVTIDGEPGEQLIRAEVDTSALWVHSFTEHPETYEGEN